MHHRIKARDLNRSLFVLAALSVTLASDLKAQPATGPSETASSAPSPRPQPIAPLVVSIERTPLESPEGMSIYETRALKPRPEVLQALVTAQKLSLQAVELKTGTLYQEKAAGPDEPAVTRMALDRVRGHMFFHPNSALLAQGKPQLLPAAEALKSAQAFVTRNELIPPDGSQVVPQTVVTRSRTIVTPNGQSQTVDVVQAVLFQRMLDQKPVLGKGAQLTVDLANGGAVVGFTRTWNQVVKSTIQPQFLKQDDVYTAIENLVKQRVRGAALATVKKPHLVYYENDGKYVTPAYFFTAVITSPNVPQNAYFAGVVAAVSNPPEPIMPAPTGGEAPIMVSNTLKGGLEKEASPSRNDPTVGRYVVRDDSSDWVDDANEFKDGLIAGHPGGFPAITFGDYFWDEPFCWTTSANAFANKWNIALMEGHGNTWLFTTEKNCCDEVHLDASTQPGYGNLIGTSMRFLILKGCAIIPAPPDRSDWPTPWWRVFKGLHQADGFRTEMYIDDDISDEFATYLAENCRVIDSLFCATDNCSSYQWERFWGSWGDQIYGYGAAVAIPGHDGDGIYSVAAAPAATSAGLTIWWQH